MTATQDFESINVLDILPQRPPFVMVDRMVWFDQVFTRTTLLVTSDNIFVDDGVFSPYGLIENIAQTCAARIGYINFVLYKSAVKLGYIGSIKNLKIHRRPRVGETIVTEIEVVEDVMMMTLVNAKITSGDELLVSAEMKIALSDVDSNN